MMLLCAAAYFRGKITSLSRDVDLFLKQNLFRESFSLYFERKAADTVSTSMYFFSTAVHSVSLPVIPEVFSSEDRQKHRINLFLFLTLR